MVCTLMLGVLCIGVGDSPARRPSMPKPNKVQALVRRALESVADQTGRDSVNLLSQLAKVQALYGDEPAARATFERAAAGLDGIRHPWMELAALAQAEGECGFDAPALVHARAAVASRDELVAGMQAISKSPTPPRGFFDVQLIPALAWAGDLEGARAPVALDDPERARKARDQVDAIEVARILRARDREALQAVISRRRGSLRAPLGPPDWAPPLIGQLAWAGYWEEAEALASSLGKGKTSAGIRATCFMDLAAARIKAGDREAAKRGLLEVESLDVDFGDPGFSGKARAWLAGRWVAAGDADKAERLASGLSRSPLAQADAYLQMAAEAISTADTPNARAWFDKADAIVGPLPDSPHRKRIRLELGVERARAGMLDDPIAWYEREVAPLPFELRRVHAAVPRESVGLVGRFPQVLAEGGSLEAAKRFLPPEGEPGWMFRSVFVGQIAGGLVRAGKPEDALDFSRTYDGSERLYALMGFAGALADLAPHAPRIPE